MKKLIFSAIAMLTFGTIAEAYNSPVGADPKNGNYDVEYKYIVKSAIEAESSSISKGHTLTYASADDGYTVTRTGGGATVNGQKAIACIVAEDIATNDINYHRCVSRGFINYAKYDATIPIQKYGNVCVNGEGVLEGCTVALTNGTGLSGTATANGSRIIPLETKTSGTGTMKVIVNIP